MNNLKNSKGVSLVELMAALALVSLVAVLIMTTLSIGIKRSVVENDKLRIQQEANIIVSKILADHRLGNPYCLAVINKQLVKMEPSEQDSLKCIPQTNIETIYNPLYNAEVYDIEIETPEGLIKSFDSVPPEIDSINPKEEDLNLDINLTYKEPTQKKASFSVNTTLSRYKTSEN